MKRRLFTILFAHERFCCKAPRDACARAIAQSMTEHRAGGFVRFDPNCLWFGQATRRGYCVWPRFLHGYQIDISLRGEGEFTLVSARPIPPLWMTSILMFGPLLVFAQVNVPLAVVWGLVVSLLFAGQYWSIQNILWEIRTVLPNAVTCDRCGYDLRATPGRCPECGFVPEVTT